MENEKIDSDMETLLRKLLDEKQLALLRKIVESRGGFSQQEGA